ncbi:hypothetical protein Trco_004378 [Trichoderma cornu-damae]|uniref:AAA+ ATPase domain-containing protein n=1 Tax=Trichoderma cornu-damae TaxID=654480 RepID=A0A9P8QME8_9HYPO|nr:hypothetical protein Trco_004378 [Trichoderma cornu-damae]
MAFHVGLLPSMVAAAADTLPSITNTLARPWRPSSAPRQQADVTVAADTARTDSEAEAADKPARVQLPDFLQQVPAHAAKAVTPGAMAPVDIRASVSGLGRVGLLAANPILRRPFFQPVNAVSPPLVSLFMPSSPAASTPLRAMSTTRILSGALGTQRRGFGTSNGISRSQLASVEESANRNPGNANLQNAFYQLLLRANMPGILVERYQTGRFATNAGTEDAYKRALAALSSGTSTVATATATPGFARGQWAGSEQAIANAALSGSMGVKGEPIHVVVQESTRSLVFRWVKFFATFIVFTYLCFAAVTILIETLSTFRRGPGAKTDSEVKAEKQTTRFDDVHGCDEAKEELQEVVEFLRNPDSFSDLGAKLPKGVLLVGPPGTGKTLLARAVAGEAGVPFFYMSGSEFDEIFVGVGAKRVRELFAAAKAKSPAIIFIDELDAIGGKRNPRDQAHSKQTLNQLLTELDGFDTDTKIIIMAATNLPKLLDKALTRPGRFDRHISVDLPDVRGRIAILKHHAKKIRLALDVDLEAIAARSPGQSGADLENMLNVAALRASRAKAREVSKQDIDWAFDRITMGAERKSMVVTEKEKEMTAYHEAGHALVQLFEKESSNRLYKVTILPKGPSLGHTAHVPAMDKYSYTAAEYMSNIRVLLGGKMAEEMRYGDDKVTSGVSNDLERATDLSFMMVTHFGMSNALGPVEYGRRYENLSSETKALIEGEVQKTLRKSYEDVRKVLTEKRKELDLLAQALVQYETLDKEEVEKVIRGEKLPGRTMAPKGPLTLPIPDEIPRPPGLGLLAKNHTVITTVRSEEKARKIRDAHPGSVRQNRLTVAVVPDISQLNAFDDVVAEAAAGPDGHLEVVLHTASPFHYRWTDAQKELIDPALNGTRGILEAVKRSAPSVRRVVVTSSFAAILSEGHLADPNTTFTEASWNPDGIADVGRSPLTAYRVSKTAAESSAWEFVKHEKPSFDVVTVNPPVVFGPLAHSLASLDAINTSNERIVALLRGQWKTEIGDTGPVGLWIDVRDAASAHIKAFEIPEAGGRRLLTVSGRTSNQEVARIVREGFPEYADRLPGPEVPGGEPAARDETFRWNSDETNKLLGIEWISIDKSISDTVRSLKDFVAPVAPAGDPDLDATLGEPPRLVLVGDDRGDFRGLVRPSRGRLGSARLGGGPGLANPPTTGGASYTRGGGLGSSMAVAPLYLFCAESVDAFDVALRVLALLKMLETLVPGGASSLGGLVGDVVCDIVVVAVIPRRSPSSAHPLALGMERGDSGTPAHC